MRNDSRWLLGWLLVVAWALTLSCPVGLLAATPNRDEQFTRGWNAYDSGLYDDALRIWQPLAKQGYVNAQLNLGVMYDNGMGVPEDPLAAVNWYRAAALQRSKGAQYNLGQMYATGRGVHRDLAEAASWYRRAAEQGLAIAQYELGLLYSGNLNIESGDPRAATGRDKKAGDGPFAAGQHNADIVEAPNRGIAQNRETAIVWLYKSGLSYLERGDTKGARMALEAISKLAPGHASERELRGKMDTSPSDADAQPSPELSVYESIGTAWPIGSGYVVTNNHVVSESKDVVLFDLSGQEIRAWVVLRDEANDLALLEVSDSQKLPPALPLSRSEVQPGARVFTIGFPRVGVLGRTPKLSKGLISATNGLRNEAATYRTTVPIEPGNSGASWMRRTDEFRC
jgi:hypothetical protein